MYFNDLKLKNVYLLYIKRYLCISKNDIQILKILQLEHIFDKYYYILLPYFNLIGLTKVNVLVRKY